jgi:methylthioribulose-1-phosphate dehydratase
MYSKFPHTEAIFILIEAANGFYTKNWMPGTSGNLSIRTSGANEPLNFVITASGKDKGALTPSDFVIVGVDGAPIEDTEHKSSAETLLHAAVYQKIKEARAVYHVHTVQAALLSNYGLTDGESIRFRGLEMLKGLGLDTHDTEVELPVLENSQDMLTLSQQLPHRIHRKVPGFLLKGHGLYTWGASPFHAKRHIEIWQYLFEYRLGELMLQGVPSSPALHSVGS